MTLSAVSQRPHYVSNGDDAVTKKMKILIPVIVFVLLGILAVNIYFSLLVEEEKSWRSLNEIPSPTQQE